MENRKYLGIGFICVGLCVSGVEGIKLRIIFWLFVKLFLDLVIFIYIRFLNENLGCFIVRVFCFLGCVMIVGNI